MRISLTTNLIEFPSGAALQIEKDRMRTKPKGKDVSDELLTLARFYINMNNITDKAVLDTKAVADTALDFIEEVCTLIGYKESGEPSTPLTA